MMAVQLVANCATHDLLLGEIVVLCGNSLDVREKKEIIIHASAPKVKVAPAKHPARLEALAVAAHQQIWTQSDMFEADAA